MGANLKERSEVLNRKKEAISQLLIDYEYANNDWDSWDDQLYRP